MLKHTELFSNNWESELSATLPLFLNCIDKLNSTKYDFIEFLIHFLYSYFEIVLLDLFTENCIQLVRDPWNWRLSRRVCKFFHNQCSNDPPFSFLIMFILRPQAFVLFVAMA